MFDRRPVEVPRTSIIWSPGRPATGTLDVSWKSLFRTFEYFFPVKESNKYVTLIASKIQFYQ